MLFRSASSGTGVDGTALVQGGHRLFLNKFTGLGFSRLPWALWSWDPSLLLAGLIGLAMAWSRKRSYEPAPAREGAASDLPVLLSFALPYGAMILVYSFTFERFLLPLVGLMAILGASGLRDLVRNERVPGVRLLVAALLAFPALVTVNLARARSAPSTLHLEIGRAHV